MDKYDIFISYSSSDEQAAQEVCQELEQAGFKCWIASRDIRPGASYPNEIALGIRKSDIFIIILSENSVRSPHVNTETDLAFNQGKRIIPFFIEKADLGDSMSYYLARKQWIIGYPDFKSHIKKLKDAIITDYHGSSVKSDKNREKNSPADSGQTSQSTELSEKSESNEKTEKSEFLDLPEIPNLSSSVFPSLSTPPEFNNPESSTSGTDTGNYKKRVEPMQFFTQKPLLRNLSKKTAVSIIIGIVITSLVLFISAYIFIGLDGNKVKVTPSKQIPGPEVSEEVAVSSDEQYVEKESYPTNENPVTLSHLTGGIVSKDGQKRYTYYLTLTLSLNPDTPESIMVSGKMKENGGKEYWEVTGDIYDKIPSEYHGKNVRLYLYSNANGQSDMCIGSLTGKIRLADTIFSFEGEAKGYQGLFPEGDFIFVDNISRKAIEDLSNLGLRME